PTNCNSKIPIAPLTAPTPQHLNLPCLLMHGMINPSDNNLMIYTKIELQNLATKFQKAGRESPSSIL
ncbi:hypothetical protein, partial [Bilophila wadsworthia]|uniref:hypothetical protein n=1 Tax=Bilophila wadsworthia TaxID=35833 RepID=UPI003AB6F236